MRLLACFLLFAAAAFPAAAAGSPQALHLVRAMISPVDGDDGAPVQAAAFHLGDRIYYYTEVSWDEASRPAGAHQLQYKWYSGDKQVLSFDGSRSPDTAPYHWFAYVDGGHLGQGRHRAELYVDGRLFDTREFDIVPDSIPLPGAVAADEDGLRKSLHAQGLKLLLDGDTEGFDRLADAFRSTRERTPAGIWKLALLYNCMKDFEIGPQDPRWPRLEGTASRWMEKRPGSPAAVIMAAKIHYHHAWAWRGEGYASEVGDDRWAPYHELLEQARSILDEHQDVAMRDPEWDAVRIDIANEQGAKGEEILALAGAALEREPYYYPIHYSASRALLPRWGGSEELVRRYVEMAVDRSRAKEGTQAYARIYFNLARSASDPLDELNGSGAKWPAMRQSLEEIRRAWPDPYNLQIERALTCYAGDAEAYRALGPVTGPQPGSIAWFDTPQRRQGCDDWAFKGKRPEPNLSLGERVHNYSSFFGGLGAVYWVPTILVAIAGVVLLEFFMWRLGGGAQAQPPAVVTPWGGSPFHPERYPRTYRFIGLAQPIGNHLAVAMVAFGAAVINAVASVPWPNPLETLTVLALPSLVAVAGGLAIARNVTRKLVLEPDAIELRGLFAARRLRRDQIAGYRLDLGGDARRAIVLVPEPASGQAELRISSLARIDEAFAQWISSLPSLERAGSSRG
jgi:hypothetical protein